MRKALLLSAVLLFTLGSFATTSINNFTGYNDTYGPFGDQDTSTQTYGEVFTDPAGANTLTSFSFYMGDQYSPGNIVLGAYLASWFGGHAGSLLYDSGRITYDNAGNEELTFNTSGVLITPGNQYVIFLSTSKYHGQSTGAAHATSGAANGSLNGFAEDNNGGDFNALFTGPWQGFLLQPDLAVDLKFDNVPEPGTLLLFGTGILGGLAVLQRRIC